MKSFKQRPVCVKNQKNPQHVCPLQKPLDEAELFELQLVLNFSNFFLRNARRSGETRPPPSLNFLFWKR